MHKTRIAAVGSRNCLLWWGAILTSRRLPLRQWQTVYRGWPHFRKLAVWALLFTVYYSGRLAAADPLLLAHSPPSSSLPNRLRD